MSDLIQQPLRVGMIGLGQIGGGIAACLARKNHPLKVYDIRPEAAESLPTGCDFLPSPMAVAKDCDVVFIAVLDGQQAESVLCGPEGIFAGARPGLCLVLLSTVKIQELNRLIRLASDQGLALLDCGVTGGALAEQGGMTCMIGGDKSQIDRIRYILEDCTSEVYHMGPVGTGMAAKIARNLIHFSVWRAGYEGAQLAIKAGVDLDKFIPLVENAARKPGGSVTIWMDPERVKGSGRMPTDPQALRQQTLLLQQKDLEAARELAAELGVDIPGSEVARLHGAETYSVEE